MIKVLVTGASGFIGSHLVDHYVDQGYDVLGVDVVEPKYNNPKAKYYYYDVSKKDLPKSIFGKVNIVNHHAAQIDARLGFDRVEFDLEQNVMSTLRLLKFTQRTPSVTKFIYASSGGAIDNSEQPQSLYGISKLTAEKYIKHYSQRYGLNSVILRYSNIYGSRQRGGVISQFIPRLLKNEPIQINGGDQTRDFVFVKDVAQINELAITLESGTYTICSETQISMFDLATTLRAMCNSTSPFQINPQISGEVMKSTLLCSDIIKNSIITPLEMGLQTTIDFHKSSILY